MASTLELSEPNLEKFLDQLSKIFETLISGVRRSAAKFGVSDPLMDTWSWLDKSQRLLWVLQARIQMSRSWHAAAEKLGAQGLGGLEEAIRLSEPLNQDTEISIHEGPLADAGKRLMEACLIYLGKDPETAGEVSHDEIMRMLRGE
jgi:hypothetical protein